MFKKGLGRGLGLVLLFLFCLPCFAQQPQSQEETFTITAYYPSPYGSYNQLEVHRSVTYKPVDKDTLSDRREGELIYNASDDSLYLYNGSSWVAQGGGGAVISLKCPAESRTGEYGVCFELEACTPPNCPSGWINLGTGCATTAVGLKSAEPAVPTLCRMGYCERWCYKQ